MSAVGKQHGVAVIGLGIMGRRMITNMGSHDRFRFAGAWDPSPQACEQAVAIAPDLRIAEKAEELIRDNATDVVYIACPPAWHREHAEAAIAAGKAVYCEKPLGIDVADSAELVVRMTETATPNIVNFAQASSRAVALTQERIKAGKLGDIAGADIIVHFSRWPRDWQADADWLRFREQGGYTREVLSHFLYLTERLLGSAELIGSMPIYQADPVLCETHILAVLDANGIPVTVHGSSGGNGPDRVEMTLWGSACSHRLHDWFELQSSDGGDWRQELSEFGDLRVDGFKRQLDNVAAWLDGEPHGMPSAHDALSVQKLIEAMLAD